MKDSVRVLETGLIGRKADLEWLKKTVGDRVLSGQPGAGKSALLQHFAQASRSQFLVGDNTTEIAKTLANQQPSTVIVDDAHLNLKRLGALICARADPSDFTIIASTWLADEDRVLAALGSPPRENRRRLELLTREEIVELYRRLGIDAPVQVMRELVDQAANKPALAVSLARSWTKGEVDEVLDGRILARTIRASQSLKDGAFEFLAALAIGGERGMPLAETGRLLQQSDIQSRQLAADLSNFGVLHQSGRHLVVRPATLRSVTLREVFFSDPATALDYRPLLEIAPDRQDAVATIVEAAQSGAEVPGLQDLVSESPSLRAWYSFASLGAHQARQVLEQYAEAPSAVASATFEHAPSETIQGLLREAVDSLNDPISPALDCLRHWLQDLRSELGDLVLRRQQVMAQARRFSAESGNRTVAIKTALLTVDPVVFSSELDPGTGSTLTDTRGLLPELSLPALQVLWQQVVALLNGLEGECWLDIEGALRVWIEPERLGFSPTDNERTQMRAVACEVIQGLAPRVNGRPGLANALARLAERAGTEINIELDPDFELLFCEIGPARNDHEAVEALAQRWASINDPTAHAAKLFKLQAEAELIGRGYSSRPRYFCGLLASQTSRPRRWFRDLLVLDSGYYQPFLARLVRDRKPGWESELVRALGQMENPWPAIELILKNPAAPEALLSGALVKADRFPQPIETLCLRREVPIKNLQRLLGSPSQDVAYYAAVGEWCSGPRGRVREEVRESWRAALLQIDLSFFYDSASQAISDLKESDFESGTLPSLSETINAPAPPSSYWFEAILKHDPELAHEWLTRRLTSGDRYLDPRGKWLLTLAISTLDAAQRAQLLTRLAQSPRLARELLPVIVERSLGLYLQLLDIEGLKDSHLKPLAGPPGERWAALAQLALDAGFSAREVAQAAFDGNQETSNWADWEAAFAQLETSPDGTLLRVARYGKEQAHRSLQRQAGEERRQLVEGLLTL